MKFQLLRTTALIYLILIIFSFKGNAQGCGGSVPSYTVNLTGNPDSLWISPSVVRADYCCAASGTDKCIEFIITLDSNSVGINFNIYSGSIPAGALNYQLGCGALEPLGVDKCLPGGNTYILTFCKPGINTNQYSIQAISSTPSLNAGLNQMICTGSNVALNGTGPNQLINWSSTGTGTFGDTSSYATNYIPDSADQATGNVNLILTGYGCNNVVDTMTLTINPTTVAGTISSSTTVCSGSNSGTLTLSGHTGTVQNWEYSTDGGTTWSNIVNTTISQSYANLTITTMYRAIVKSGTCPSLISSLATITVNPPPIITATPASSTICNGGSINLAAAGATTYTWSPATGLSATTGATVIASPTVTTTYTITGTDGNGCTNSKAATVTVASPLNLTISKTDATCTGCADGFANASVTGGTPAYIYSWSNGANTPSISGLVAGTYTVTVTDANGCNNFSSVIITEPAAGAPVASFTNGSTILCQGNSVSFTDQSTGSPTIWSWNFGDGGTSTLQNPTHLYSSSGSYFVTLFVSNANGSDSLTLTINVTIYPTPLIIISKTDATCTGCSNGSASTAVTGGTTPYFYNWSNGATSANVTNLIAGTYTLTVTDNSSCSSIASVTINEPAGCTLSLTATTTNSACGGNSGSATLSISGGSSPYKIIWNNGDTTLITDSLSAGLYQVRVTDINGCTKSLLVTISETGAPAVSVFNINNVTCPSGNNGAININVTGGVTPYTYLWGTGATTEDISNLMAGAYEVFVKGNNGCLAAKRYVVTEPALLKINKTSVNANCGAADGSASVSIIGGTSPYVFNWSNGGSTAAVTNLATGVYKVTITDINGCSDSAAVSVNEVGAPLITIDTVINATCIAQSGSISITVTGGASPYAYSWNNGATTEDLTGVADGAYSITVTGNGNGCKATAAALIDILAPKPVICMVTVDSVTGTNLAVWEKQTGLGIKSYNVYKESTQAGVYYKLGNVPFDSLSVFNDTLSNPLVRAWRYKLTAIDNCGNESGKSPEHKTMHVTINHGVNNSVNLIWDNYIGFNFGTFYIYRYSNLKGWSVIDSIPSNLSSYTDFNPERGFLNYAIEFIHPFGCAATRANNFNSSRSNRSQSIASPAGTTPDAIVENNSISDVMVYPNPTTGMFTLEMETLETTTIVIYDLQGKLVISEKMDTGKKQIDLSHVGRGVYHLQVISDKGMVNKKVVVN